VTTGSWEADRKAYEHAANWFVGVTAQVDDRWDRPGLGEWSVRDLVGHASRALLTVESYLDQPATAIELTSPVAYLAAMAAGAGSPAQVAERGRQAGAALGDQPAAAVAEIAERVLARVARAGPDDLVATPVGGIRLADYLPTRTFELTVHTCDLAAAVGADQAVPADAATVAAALIGTIAAHRRRAAPLLLAATGRGPLPDGYSVLPS
jgi:uncharacterized protein (TIGR03083 family)